MPRAEGIERSAMLDIASYNLVLNLTGNSDMFSSRVEIRFRCERADAETFADLQAADVRRAVLNGQDLDLARAYRPGRLELSPLAGDNTLVVEADFDYTSTGAGLFRVIGPGGDTYVYSKGFPGGAPRIFCCFDEVDLRAPFTATVKAPSGWTCRANAPVVSRPAAGDAGLWTFATTPPISAYLSSFYAGPFAGPTFVCERAGRPSVSVATSAPESSKALLEAAMGLELFCQPLRYYERSLGAAFPYDKWDVVFVPDFPGLAFGPPGLVTIKDTVLAGHRDDRSGLYLATVIAHELAHAWCGGLLDISGSDDTWLGEPLTTYLCRTALEEIHAGATPWAPSVSRELPDHAYAGDAATVRQLEALIGRQAVLDGLGDLMRRHAHGCATKDDLVESWSRASGRDLHRWAGEVLVPTPRNEGDEDS